MNLDHLRELLTARRIGRQLVYLPRVTSTMDVARERTAGGGPEGLVIIAEQQTAGRGRFGRAWLAPPGVNLSFSILLRPDIARMKRLGIVAPLAVADGVGAVCGVEVAFKWPNDVRIGERKVCGILIEGGFTGDRPEFAIVGIGLNVNLDTAAFPEIAPIATSLARELGRPVEREAVLAAVLDAFERRYLCDDAEALLHAWRERLETLGQEVEVSVGGVRERGVAEDVAGDGALVLRRADGTRIVLPAGEVSLRPPGS